MADPRFFENRGPFDVRTLCEAAGLRLPEGADPAAVVFDVAGLTQAAPTHLSFYVGERAKHDLAETRAGWCIVGAKDVTSPPRATVALAANSVPLAFAAVARKFYSVYEMDVRSGEAIHKTARLGTGVVIAPGVIIGAGAEIGPGTRIGANSVIGAGVMIGQDCEIGANASIAFALLGDGVVVKSGVRIGGSGFGFASGPRGHTRIPQLGRVIIQDRVEIGSNTTVDRGALADTVIGEGSKIDNLVQIGHNSAVGRHCVIAGQVGLSGSVILGDFVVLGGQVGIADHLTIGDGARVAAKSGVTHDLAGGKDYGGFPAKPVAAWRREMAILARSAKSRKQHGDG